MHLWYNDSDLLNSYIFILLFLCIYLTPTSGFCYLHTGEAPGKTQLSYDRTAKVHFKVKYATGNACLSIGVRKFPLI